MQRGETTTLHDSLCGTNPRLVLLFGDLDSPPPYHFGLSLDQLLPNYILSVALPRTRRRTNCTSTAICSISSPELKDCVIVVAGLVLQYLVHVPPTIA
jgi:hypothetical protein